MEVNYIFWGLISIMVAIVWVLLRAVRQQKPLCVTVNVQVDIVEPVLQRRLGEISGELRAGWSRSPLLKDLDRRFEFGSRLERVSGFYILNIELFHNNQFLGIVLRVYMDDRSGAVSVLFPDGKQDGKIAANGHAVTAAKTFLMLYTPAEHGYIQKDA